MSIHICLVDFSLSKTCVLLFSLVRVVDKEMKLSCLFCFNGNLIFNELISNCSELRTCHVISVIYNVTL